MPKPTFFNLPDPKRQLIIDLALAEFAEHGPAAASVSRIVARAGIAKGSLYQYFADKQDLFLYLVDLANAERIAFMEKLRPPRQGEPFFPYLRWVMEQSALFRFSNPYFGPILQGALYSDYQGRGQATRRVRETIAQVWGRLIQHGMRAGAIDPSYDPAFVTWALTTLTLELSLYMLEQVPPDPQGIEADLYKKRYFTVYRDLVRLLEHGLRPTSKEN